MPWGLFTGHETVERRANFGGRGTLPVESLEFGLSPFGCYQMAGNVAEWCRNPFDEGFATTGGSWGDPPYQFSNYGTFPGSYSSGKLGFRCVRNAPGVTGDQGAMPLDTDAASPSLQACGRGDLPSVAGASTTATRSRRLTRRSWKSKRPKTGDARKSPTSVRKVNELSPISTCRSTMRRPGR